MEAYHIRYTCSGELQERVVDFIKRNALNFIISKEFATREHIQCYVEANITKKTWTNKFNIAFKGMDRRDKYVEPDKGKTKIYVCKGDSPSSPPDILGKRGFSDEEITAYHNQYWEEHLPEGIKEAAANALEIVAPEVKVKKQRTPTFMERARNELELMFPDRIWTSKDRPIVFKKVMLMLGQHCKNLDHIIISRMVYGVMNSLIKDHKEWLEYWYAKSFNDQLEYDEQFCAN